MSWLLRICFSLRPGPVKGWEGGGDRVTPHCVHRAPKNSLFHSPPSSSALAQPQPCPPCPILTFRGEEGAVQGAKGSPRVSRRPLPTPTPCEFVLQSSLASLPGLGVGELKLQLQTGWRPGAVYLKAPARPEPVVSLETSSRGKELGRAAKRCGVFSSFCPFSLPPPPFAPFSELLAEPANFEEVVAEWEKSGVRVLDFFFFFLISTFFPTLRGCSRRLLPVPRQPRAASS